MCLIAASTSSFFYLFCFERIINATIKVSINKIFQRRYEGAGVIFWNMQRAIQILSYSLPLLGNLSKPLIPLFPNISWTDNSSPIDVLRQEIMNCQPHCGLFLVFILVFSGHSVSSKNLKCQPLWASLVAQWLGIRLPTQGTRVQALVREDLTCRRATKPVSHNY